LAGMLRSFATFSIASRRSPRRCGAIWLCGPGDTRPRTTPEPPADGAPCGSGDFFSMPPKPCVVTGAGMTITNPRRGCSGPGRASLFDRPQAGVRDPDAGDLDRLAASLQAFAPSSPASVIRAGRAARLKETPTVKAGRVKCVFGGSLGVVLDKRPPCS